MRALIILCHRELEGRFERAMPPEHRIRARRETDVDVVELLVVGPMLPEVVDGQYQRGDLQMTMHADDNAGELWLEACWRFWEAPHRQDRSADWEIGRWSSVADMMDFMR
jgi:hypothetical protein